MSASGNGADPGAAWAAGEVIALADLNNRPLWVAWQEEYRDDGKPTKVPYASDGRKAKANGPVTWGTREKAEQCAVSLPKPLGAGGIGIELSGLGNGINMGGIDLDTCRSPDGTLTPWASEVTAQFNTYVETSPSGTGCKLFFTYDEGALQSLRDMGLIRGKPGYGRMFKRGNGEHPPAIELHLGNRYFAVTDQPLPGSPPSLRHLPIETLVWLLREAGPRFVGTKAKASTDASRSAVAFRMGAALRRGGKTFEEMCNALRTDPETADWCRDKGDINGGRELHRIWDRADLSAVEGFDLHEDGIALAFANRFRDRLRYCHHEGTWYEWNGNVWVEEQTELAFTWARETCRQIAQEARAEGKLRSILAKASTAAAVERYAQADRAFAVTSEIWDRDPLLLGTPCGTVDLRTGRLRAAVQSDFITKQTTVVAAEVPDCPLWLRFLDDATRGDNHLVRFLRQWCGYCLTGDISEHALLFIFGPGGNGKTVLLNTVSRILGNYAAIAAMDAFTAARGERHPTDLAMLRGARLVCVAETEEGHAWAENRIKALTGGDPITARFMRQDFFTYRPQFKITIIGNHKPALRNVDDANRRRFNLAPFVHKPTSPDKELEQKLLAEHPTILRWMIEGCLDWQMHGLLRPTTVASATSEYFSEQDTIRQWVEECCETAVNASDTFASLYASWRNYAHASGEDTGSSKSFATKLQYLGFVPLKDTDGIRGRGYSGITVKVFQTPSPPEYD